MTPINHKLINGGLLGMFETTGELRQPWLGEYYACDHIAGVAVATEDTRGVKRIVVPVKDDK